MREKVWIGLFVLMIGGLQGMAQTKKSLWVDSVLNTLDLSARIGQLLMVPVNSADEDERDRVNALIRNQKIGGIVCTAGSPVAHTDFINQLQQTSDVPLLIGMNAEEGVGAVLDSALKFPAPLILGALRNDSLLYFLGEEIGRQLKLLGIHINFAPTVNLVSSLQDENLFLSAYGEDKHRVASRVVNYQSGLKQSNILTVAKYYPDYGMRVQGFQKGVPQVKTQSDPDGLFPLQKLIEQGCAGVVNAYEQAPMLTPKKKLLTTKRKTVSSAVPTLYSAEYLRRQLHFNGIVFSFIPDIRDLNKKFRAGDSELFAFRAGNDVLLYPLNPGSTVRKMRREIRKNAALQNQLNESVKKILGAKFDAGLATPQPVDTETLRERLTTLYGTTLQEYLCEKSITIIKDEQHVLPLAHLENHTFASLSIGRETNASVKVFSKYAPVEDYTIQSAEDTVSLLNTLRKYSVVTVFIYPEAAALEPLYTETLQKMKAVTKVIVVVFDSPAKLSLVDAMPTIIQAYTDEAATQKNVPQIIFGAKSANGNLPVTINSTIIRGTGLTTSLLDRLSYTAPEAVGVDGTTLNHITQIAEEAIDQQAAPGCQVIVARKGKIVYEKSFGWQTYDKNQPINDQSIYDIASVTKVAATLQVTMFLYEKGLLDIYKKASFYLPELAKSNKKDLIVKDILTHQAGLIPFVPFWVNTVKDSLFLPEYYSLVKTEQYPWQVAPNLFAVKSLRDSLWSWSIQSKLRDKPPRTPYTYVYSDIGLYILHHINEKLINQPQEEFLQQNLYDPLGAVTMGYLPLERFDAQRIVPTEQDKIFRRSLLTGTVHDEGAAMLGGVAGHAGLFSNAHDLVKLGQMLLQGGSYGGIQYYKPETVAYFTTKQFDTSRRGLGWDKPVHSEWNNPASFLASPKTYGHTGFTGTCIWIDPQFDLVYVFLSNRVYPSRNQNKLSTLNIRSRIQDVIYQSIFNYCQFGNEPETTFKFLKY